MNTLSATNVSSSPYDASTRGNLANERIEIHVLQPPYEAFCSAIKDAGQVVGLPRGSMLAVRPGITFTANLLIRTITSIQRHHPHVTVLAWLDRVRETGFNELMWVARRLRISAFVTTRNPDPTSLRRQLTELRHFHITIRHWLRVQGVRLPATDRVLVSRLIRYSVKYRTFAELAADRGPPERQWRRHFSRAGIGGPGAWFQVMRMLAIALAIQRADRITLDRFARRYSFYDSSALSHRCQEVLGARPREIRRWLGWEWLLLPALRRQGLLTGTGTSAVATGR